MRKSAKILALLLTLVIVIGTVAIAAFADTTTTTHPTRDLSSIEGITNWGYEGLNYEGYTFHQKGNSQKEGNAPSGHEYGVPAKAYGHFQSVNVTGSDGRTNTHATMWMEAGEEYLNSTTTNAYIDFNYRFKEHDSQHLGQMKYFVIDFDIACDRYLTADGKLTTNLEEALKNDDGTGVLAYNGINGVLGNRTESYGVVGSVLTFQTTTNTETGHPEMKLTASAGGAVTVPLSNNIGEWTHFTVVIVVDTRFEYKVDGTAKIGTLDEYKAETSETKEIVRSYLSQSDMHVYVDGEKKLSAKYQQESYDTSHAIRELYNIRWNLDNSYRTETTGEGEAAVTKHFTTKSQAISFDNIAANAYAANYTGDSVDATLADAFTLGSEAPARIGGYDDMVYTYSYAYPTPNTPVATITSADGSTVTPYFTVEAAAACITPGVTLTLNEGVELKNYNAVCNFTVKCAEGAFSVIGTKKADWIPGSGCYEVKDATEFVEVYFYESAEAAAICENTEGTLEILGDYNIPFGSTMLIPEGVYEEFVLTGNHYKWFKGWGAYYFDENGENPTNFDLTKPVDGEEFLYLQVYPIFEEGDLLYGIFSASTKELLTDSAGGYAKYADGSTFYTESAAAFDKSDTLVAKLYADITYEQSNFIELSQGRHYYLDLNGHTLVATSRANSSAVFNTSYSNNGAYVYSSQPGGRLFRTDSANYGAVVFQVSNGATIQAGAVEDPLTGNTADGDNLSIYAPKLFHDGQVWNPKVTIDGGSYYSIRDDYFFRLSVKTVLNIRNATIYSQNGIIFTSDKSNTCGNYFKPGGTYYNDCTYSAVVNIENSTIITGGSVFGELFKGLQVNITNSDIYGSLELSHIDTTAFDATHLANSLLGTVTLGEGTKITDNNGYTHINYASDTLPTAYSDASTPIINWYKVTYDEEYAIQPESLTTPISASITTPLVTEIVSTAGKTVATITYLDANGNVIITQREIVGAGSSVVGPTGKVPTVALGNGWFDFGFTYWADPTTGARYDFTTVENGAEITVKAVCETPVEALVGYVNARLMTKFEMKTYLPAIANGETSITIEVNGKNYIITDVQHFNGSKSSINGSVVMINGQAYRAYSDGYPSADVLTGRTVYYYVTYTVTAQDDPTNTVTFTEAKITNPYAGLANYLLTALETATTDEDKALVANVIQYCNEVYDYVYTVPGKEDTRSGNPALHQKLVDILLDDAYKGYVTDINSEAFNTKLADEKLTVTIPAGLATHIKGITMLYQNNVPAFAIIPIKNVTSEGVNADNDGIASIRLELGKFANESSVTYLSLYPDCVGYQDYTSEATQTGYWVDLASHINAYYGANTFKFVITVDDGEGGTEVYELRYNLATYIDAIESNANSTELERQGAQVARAFRAFADSALEFIAEPVAQ